MVELEIRYYEPYDVVIDNPPSQETLGWNLAGDCRDAQTGYGGWLVHAVLWADHEWGAVNQDHIISATKRQLKDRSVFVF